MNLPISFCLEFRIQTVVFTSGAMVVFNASQVEGCSKSKVNSPPLDIPELVYFSGLQNPLVSNIPCLVVL